jgi:hypothetical protein
MQPYCGDGNLDAGETCEVGDTTSCTTAGGYSGTKTCDNTCNWGECTTGEYCGDSIVNDGEQCDVGSNNGVGCTPGCGSSCDYCDSDCTTETNFGGSCCDPITECCYPGAPGCGGNPVPEFSLVTLGLAVIGAGLGLALLRKK